MSKRSGTLSVVFSQQHRRRVSKLVPSLAKWLKVKEKGRQTVHLTPDELEEVFVRAQYSRPRKPHLKEELRGIRETVSKVLAEFEKTGLVQEEAGVFQFKITLLEIEPPIWRRFQVPDMSLAQLHQCIQGVMGWEMAHLYEFTIRGECYTVCLEPHPFFGNDDMKEASNVMLSDVIPQTKRRLRFRYCYDFGDNWEHRVDFEGMKPAKEGQGYPLCMEGARACPPEDIGGVWGYSELLRAIADPSDEDHEYYGELSRSYDPEAFDAEQATRRMRHAMLVSVDMG